MRSIFIFIPAAATATLASPSPAQNTAEPATAASTPPAPVPTDGMAQPPEDTPAAAAPAQPAGPTPAQTMSMAEWPADRRAAYDRWPAGVKGHFWSLSEERQSLFWRLRDDDKVRLSGMAAAEQEGAWSNLKKDAAGTSSSEQPTTRGDKKRLR